MDLKSLLPAALHEPARRVYRRFRPAAPEPLMYRIHLFEELLGLPGREAFQDTRILEIGPRDGLDSKRLAGLNPSKLIMLDLPEKRELMDIWLQESDRGTFSLIWCTGVLYHNAEQLRFLRKLYTMLEPSGWLVLESATLRGSKRRRDGNYVQIHWPNTYRDTGTATHLPTAGAIRTWLDMAGFGEVHASRCFDAENKNPNNIRMACIAQRGHDDSAASYYAKSGLNPDYLFGDATKWPIRDPHPFC
jgi:hypothetical protein